MSAAFLFYGIFGIPAAVLGSRLNILKILIMCVLDTEDYSRWRLRDYDDVYVGGLRPINKKGTLRNVPSSMEQTVLSRVPI